MEVWNTVLTDLKREIPAPMYRAFIEPVRARVSENTLFLDVADEKKLRHIQKHYIGSIEKAWQKQVSHGRIRLLQAGASQVREQSAEIIPQNSQPDAEFYPHPLNRSIAEQLLILRFPAPIVCIEGPTASGKTTLLRSLEASAGRAGWRVHRCTLESFISEFAIACRNKTTVDFRRGLTSHHLLLIDDLQFLKQTAVQTQEEIRHLLESAGTGPTIILTSDAPVDNLPLRPDLLSRLRGAYRLRLALPDESTRLRLFLQYCTEAEVKPDVEALRQVRRLSDVRELRGLAMRLGAGVAFEPRPDFSAQDVISAAAEFLRVRAEDITGNGKDRPAVHARHMVMYICKTVLGMGPSKIARAFNRKNHTSVLYALERAQKLAAEDLFFQSQTEEVVSRCVRH